MDKKRKAGGAGARINYEWKARVIKALAHPSRLIMIDELAKGEKCVCELQRAVGADITTVSKHLSLMKKAGIVEDRREGVWIYYRLKAPCILRVLDYLDVAFQSGGEEEPVMAYR